MFTSLTLITKKLALETTAEALAWEEKEGLQNLHIKCIETDDQLSVLFNLLSCLNIPVSHTDGKRRISMESC